MREHSDRINDTICSDLRLCIRNYDSSSYIGIDLGREIIKKTQLAYNSRTKKLIVQLFVPIEPEGKGGHLNVLFQSSNCLLQENKKSSCFNSSPGQIFSVVSSSSLSSSSRVSIIRDRNGFKERKLCQLL